jgi:hypothetical protein
MTPWGTREAPTHYGWRVWRLPLSKNTLSSCHWKHCRVLFPVGMIHVFGGDSVCRRKDFLFYSFSFSSLFSLKKYSLPFLFLMFQLQSLFFWFLIFVLSSFIEILFVLISFFNHNSLNIIFFNLVIILLIYNFCVALTNKVYLAKIGTVLPSLVCPCKIKKPLTFES